MTHPQTEPGRIELRVGCDQCECTAYCQRKADWFDIKHADPVVNCTAEALTELLDREMATLSGNPFRVQCIGEQGRGMVLAPGEFLTLTGRNRTLVYQLVAYDFERHIFTMAWPD